jgi:hypothetical protein
LDPIRLIIQLLVSVVSLAATAQLIERAAAFGGLQSKWSRSRGSSSKKRFIGPLTWISGL